MAIAVFGFFVAVVLGLSFWLGAKAKSAKGYYAAHGQIPWFINGVAFAGDYLSAASFLGICGMIATSGYDGFLYSIGYLAGWIVALLVNAEPIKRLGKFTFADALDSKFNSRSIKLTAAISTLVVSIFYLIPQMVGAGALVKPLLGLDHVYGVVIVGAIVIVIVTTAGMVSTTWVQFIKGAMLVFFCAILTVMILMRGFHPTPADAPGAIRVGPASELIPAGAKIMVAESTPWAGKAFVRVENPQDQFHPLIFRHVDAKGTILAQTQVMRITTDKVDGSKVTWINGKRQGRGADQGDFRPVGGVRTLPGGVTETGPLGPVEFFRVLQNSTVDVWKSETIVEGPTVTTTVYFPVPTSGEKILVPGGGKFAGIDKNAYTQINFISLMLALFCGTASLPHILIRYYTVKDQASARKSTVVGIASIGFFYVLTLYLGLGAMTGGVLDPADASGNMAAPLLARSFGELPFAVISAIAFTTVLGTVSGLILAASGAVAHDIMENFLKRKWDDHAKVKAGKTAAVVVGLIAIVLGILFQKMNVSFLVGWAFSIAASANLPSLVMLLFWKRTTAKGISAAIVVGMCSSLTWILLSKEAYVALYGVKDLIANPPLVPFDQPGIVTIPLGFAALIVVSLMTKTPRSTPLADSGRG